MNTNGSLFKKKPPKREQTVRTPDNVERVHVATLQSPTRSLETSLESEHLVSTLKRLLIKEFQREFHPYKLAALYSSRVTL